MTISYSKQLYSNNASTEVLYSIGPEDTSISVLDASKFPTPGAAEFFTVTLDDGVSLEIIRVGAVIGNVLAQLTRGVEGSTPRPFTSGTMVEARLTSAAIRDFARTLDIMTPVSLVADLAAPETLNNHSYVISEGDDTGSPIVATVGGNVWHLLNYPVQRVSQEATAITSTSVEYTSVDDLSTVFTTKGLVVQFTTGANRGQCRLVTSATSTTLSWTTPLVNIPSSGDTFTVSQSIASKFQTFIGVDVVTLTQVNTAVEDGISAHIAATNPHPQYTTDAEAAATAGSAVTAHVAAADPHTQYTTDAEAATIAESAVTAHVALPNPHPQYATTPGLGDGQTWVADSGAGHVFGTYYPNTSGRSIMVSAIITVSPPLETSVIITCTLATRITSSTGSPTVIGKATIDTRSTLVGVIPDGYSFVVLRDSSSPYGYLEVSILG